jgi:hypothetical protein
MVRPTPARRARPLPWIAIAGIVAAVVGVMVVLTLYLPALQAARQGNRVQVDDLTIRMEAHPDRAFAHGVDLDLSVEPAVGEEARVDVLPTMPTMGSMTATTQVTRTGPGTYRAVADLGMGGLWQVQVTVARAGRSDAVARFRLNA